MAAERVARLAHQLSAASCVGVGVGVGVDATDDAGARSEQDDAASPVVLVTFVKHFLGGAAAVHLARAGFRVVCHDPSFAGASDKAEAERAAWVADARQRASVAEHAPRRLVATARTTDDAEELVADVVRHCGRIDALLSNDPYPATRSPLAAGDGDLVRQSLEALVVRPYLLASQVVRQMRRQPPRPASHVVGKLVFVTSAAPLRGLANYTPYATARGAANAMAVSLARELAAERITVIALAPNFVASPTYFSEEILAQPQQRAKIEGTIPLRRLASPDEAAHTVVFLCSSPHSDFYTGHIFPFAGGWA